MAVIQTKPDAAGSPFTSVADPLNWHAALRAELDSAVVRGNGRWSRALVAVAWIHLLTFLGCHVLHDPGVERDVRHLVLWVVELAAVIIAMRRVAGLGWFWSSPAINVIARLWVTFLILSFNVATLNALTGWESLWFKASWGTLSTFLFAALAWLFTPKFLIPAAQMYFTALLMARFPEWNNLIYGVSWWAALMGTAWVVRQRERTAGISRGARQEDEALTEPSPSRLLNHQPVGAAAE